MYQTLKNNLLQAIAILLLVAGSVSLAPAIVHADGDINIRGNANCGSGNQAGSNITLGGNATEAAKCKPTENENAQSGIAGIIRTVINVFSAIVGSISVIMIIVGGFRYVTSAGDSNNVGAAKNTIMYAIVGLIIVAFAQILVQFVLQRTVQTPAS